MPPALMMPATSVFWAWPVVMSPATCRLSCPIFSCSVMRDMRLSTNSSMPSACAIDGSVSIHAATAAIVFPNLIICLLF